MLRHRKRVLQSAKKLDAFSKTSEECTETTSTGGTLSILSFILMIWLLIWEWTYFLDTQLKFRFTPDTDFREKLKINVDITVAMPCKLLGADVLDVTGQQLMAFGELDMEDTWWELDPDQLVHFEGMQRVNSYLREQFHSLHDLLWKNGYMNLFGGTPKRKVFPSRPFDACKITGSLTINKVAGNFHITAGKTIPLPRGHAHLAVFMEDRDYNFSHRIEKFSFGSEAPGVIHPLEGDEQVAEKNFMTYQYFINVVPTRVYTYRYRGSTFQYSVSEQWREISHEKGSHGTPGIFFKYDVSALKVEVREEHESFLRFLTRLCGIIGGVFTCSGILNKIIGFLTDCLFCHYYRKPLLDVAANIKTPASNALSQSNFKLDVASSSHATASLITPLPTTPDFSTLTPITSSLIVNNEHDWRGSSKAELNHS